MIRKKFKFTITNDKHFNMMQYLTQIKNAYYYLTDIFAISDYRNFFLID